MYCPPLNFKQKRVYRYLVILLLSALLFQSALPLPATRYTAWDESLIPWPCRRRPLRYRRYQRVWLRLLARRLKVLCCRMGLVSGLLLWRGWGQQQPWPWLLLGIPLLEGVLPLLFLWKPVVVQRQGYVYLGWGLQQAYLLVLSLLLGECLSQTAGQRGQWMLLLGPGIKMADGGQARGWQEADGSWQVELTGSFRISFKPSSQFEERVFLYFLRQIRPLQGGVKHSFLRQSWLAEWFDSRQELLSRWEKYVSQGGLLKLLGEPTRWVLTPQVVTAILDIWVPNFWLSANQVRERLVAAGQIASVEDIPEGNIHRVARESGFAEVRGRLRQLFTFRADGPQWREGVLLERLFTLNEKLIARLKSGTGLTPHLLLEQEALNQAAGSIVPPWPKPLPLAYQLQRTLFGHWQAVEDGSVCCPHCGSTVVARKENKPRRKKYRDPQTGQWQEIEGYRYYCRHLNCLFGTFTDYPQGIRLYSCWTIEQMVWGVAVYMKMGTSYRRAAEAVGVSHVTLWRWAQLVGQQALPLATLFGLVRSSGVVGIDEKWVLVPKNDKPAGKRRRWMYLYLAVDVHTYDLLHLDLFAHNGTDAARLFLQALKAKGYQPQVIVTDMNQDYSEPVRQVFPNAKHHECLFHALQWTQRLIKAVYGQDYAKTHPEAEELKQAIYQIFKAKSRKTVRKRFNQVMTLKAQYLAQNPETKPIFDFLERHYPKLVNAVEDPLTPLTNNSVELVIRRFDQHYQNMAGFDSIETARTYLNLFELFYRFTPFAKDNRPVNGRELDIRGKCPLELAGYDISHMPIAQIIRAQILGWPPLLTQQLVPNT